ncbi:hypothetical protein MKW98_031912 [Papaver atlanticum]|uniref:Uncharacterized protein n=1 Tax=Papaver atlanticum TaxID=357466 RepID=A0AAD4XDZ0_9MAGN|nr:hypothetical protein MKW98_031912 [Papaver atlanticum]
MAEKLTVDGVNNNLNQLATTVNHLALTVNQQSESVGNLTTCVTRLDSEFAAMKSNLQDIIQFLGVPQTPDPGSNTDSTSNSDKPQDGFQALIHRMGNRDLEDGEEEKATNNGIRYTLKIGNQRLNRHLMLSPLNVPNKNQY